jgi:hypothetical protein
LFVVTFFKFRLWDYYRDVIGNLVFYDSLSKYTQNRVFENAFLFCSLWGLFSLNIYWFVIICKMIAKQFAFLKTIAAEITTHFMTSAMFCMNTFIAGYAYSLSFEPRLIYFADLFGIFILSCNSFQYHNRVYEFMMENDYLDYLSDEIIPWFMFDKSSIHLRSFLCLVTAAYGDYMSIYVMYSLVMHFIYYTLTALCVYTVIQHNVSITTKEEDREIADKFIFMTNIITAFPCIIDTAMISYNSSNTMSRVNLVIITLILAFVLKVKPLYNMNHISFHVCLMFQTFFLVSCNIHK